jgi:hypothetical protein
MSGVTDLQLEDLPGVEPHLITKLKRAGIQSVLDLAVSIPHELALGSVKRLCFIGTFELIIISIQLILLKYRWHR